MAFSPDGRRLVSGFHDGTVRLWDVATQTEVATLEGHTGWVASVSFSPDGALLASAGGWDDPTVILWDAATQAQVATLRGHTSEVRSVAFSSPNGGTLASAGGGQDPTVRLWDVATGEPIATLEEHTGPVHSVTFSRDGVTLASGASDGRVLLRDLESRNAAGLSGHESLSAMALSPGAFTPATLGPDPPKGENAYNAQQRPGPSPRRHDGPCGAARRPSSRSAWRTQLRIAWDEGSNSWLSSSGVRPDLTNSELRRIRAMRLGHEDILLFPKYRDVHQTGGTPQRYPTVRL